MLEEVVIPNRYNVKGERYGFVRFSNVRDVSKLLKAVNAVCFGNFHIVAKVANFDKEAAKAVASETKANTVVDVGNEEPVAVLAPKSARDGGEGLNHGKAAGGEGPILELRGATGTQEPVSDVGVSGEAVVMDKKNQGSAPLGRRRTVDQVTVGDVPVRLGDGERTDHVSKGGKGGAVRRPHAILKVGGQPSIQKQVRKYRSQTEDLLWARNGVTATVLNGESVPLIQDRIADAGVTDIDIIPLGADKVFVRSTSDVSVTTILNDAKEFFAHFFSNVVRWEKNVTPFQRGAWVRMYGIPLHAWNEGFFKLCTLDVGRFLRAAPCTVEKVRFDYARVLVATSSLDIINRKDEILVDGTLVSVHIVEEWGFHLGDDACLYEEDDNASNIDKADHEDVRSEHVLVTDHANVLVDEIVREFAQGEGKENIPHQDEDVHPSEPVTACLHQNQGDRDDRQPEEAVQKVSAGPLVDQFEVQATFSQDRNPEGEAGVTMNAPKLVLDKAPSGTIRSSGSGPWSLDWLDDQHICETEVGSVARKDVSAGACSAGSKGSTDAMVSRRKKVKGVLRHPVHSLKKVARMPSKDRAAVMKALKKRPCKFKGSNSLKKAVRMMSNAKCDSSSSSSSAVNSDDWRHWVVLHGSEKVVRDDLRSLGETIGVSITGGNNTFGVLAGKGKGKLKEVELVVGKGGEEVSGTS